MEDQIEELKKKLLEIKKGSRNEALLYQIDTLEVKVSDLKDLAKEQYTNLTKELKTEIEYLESKFTEKLEEAVMKGGKGDEGKPGKDYVLTSKDKTEISKLIKVPIVEKETVVEKTEVIRETPIVTQQIVERALYEEPNQIIYKVNNATDQIDNSRIKGFSDLEKLARLNFNPTMGPSFSDLNNLSRRITVLESNPSGSGTVGPGVTNEIAYFDSTTTIKSLTTVTYPSLTELSYLKGVTSSIQTQINAKGNVTKVGTPVDNQVGVWTGNGTIEGDANLTFDGSTLSTKQLILTQGTITTNTPTIDGSASWNNAASDFTGYKLNITRITSLNGGTGGDKYLDLQAAGVGKIAFMHNDPYIGGPTLRISSDTSDYSIGVKISPTRLFFGTGMIEFSTGLSPQNGIYGGFLGVNNTFMDMMYYGATAQAMARFYGNGNTPAIMMSYFADGATTVCNYIDTGNTLSTTGAKILSIRNNQAEKAYFDKDGILAGKTGATAKFATHGGKIKEFYTDVGNVGTGEDDLYTYTTEASILGTNGDTFEMDFGGVFVSSATATRQLKLYFGGTLVFDSGALTLSLSAAWNIYATFVRVSSSVVRCTVSMTTEGAALAAYTSYTEVTGLTLSNTNILKLTGEAAGVGAATNDIVAKLGAIWWYPVSQ